MIAARRVARTRAQLQIVVLLSALLWAGTILLVVLVVDVLLGTRTSGSSAHDWDWVIAMTFGAIAACWVLWRARFVLSRRRVALWMEEHAPSLQYALVTASDPLVTDDTSLLETVIERSNIDSAVRLAVFTPLIYSVVALSILVGLFAAATTVTSNRVLIGAHNALAGIGIHTPVPNRLSQLTGRVVAPSYAGGSVTTMRDPSVITALVGSSITLGGPGGSTGIGARLDSADVRVLGRTGDWGVAFSMPATATTVTLTDRTYDRVIAIIPIVDQPPTVVMMQPTRDTVWRHVPPTNLVFVARATDDIGLSIGHVEYTVTTGSGEIFKSHTSSIGTARFNGTRTAELRASLNLSQLGLTEGALLSVRAVVSDNNVLTGPATATSDTRTFRVARADEYDSLAVEAAPPSPAERSLLTERMLIISAESLLKQRGSRRPSDYVSSAGGIGADQADLRKKVYGILYEQDEAGGVKGVEGDDEELDPQLVLNRNLKEAYDAMWDAERSLNIAELNVALPFMSHAARALDRARLANRLYLRGRSPRVVVNIEKVRLTGKEKGIGNVVMTPSTRADTASTRLDSALNAALTLARSDPSRLADALIRLRAETSRVDTASARAIGDAVDALRAGKDMTPSLVRARRSLLGAPRVGEASLPWSGAWSGTRGGVRNGTRVVKR